MADDIANPDAIGYKADAGETTTPPTAPRARANLPTWAECCAIPSEKRSALEHFIFFYEIVDGDSAAAWHGALADVLAEASPILPRERTFLQFVDEYNNFYIVVPPSEEFEGCKLVRNGVVVAPDHNGNFRYLAPSLVSDQPTWQTRDTYRGTPGTRPWFWWYRAGAPPTMDDAWIDGGGKIASKGDGFGYRYSHVMPVERPLTVPGEKS